MTLIIAAVHPGGHECLCYPAVHGIKIHHARSSGLVGGRFEMEKR